MERIEPCDLCCQAESNQSVVEDSIQPHLFDEGAESAGTIIEQKTAAVLVLVPFSVR